MKIIFKFSGVLVLGLTFTAAALAPLSSAQAEFASRRVRYVSTYDVLNLLNKNFPGHGQDRIKAINFGCDSVNVSNRDVLGTNSTISGQPLMERPNPGLMRWLNQCLTQYTKFEFEPSDSVRPSFLNDYFPKGIQKSVLAGATGPQHTKAVANYLAKPWNSIPEATRSELIDHMIRKMIGPPEVLKSYFPDKEWSILVTSVEKTAATMIPATATVGAALATSAHTIFLRDEFLRY